MTAVNVLSALDSFGFAVIRILVSILWQSSVCIAASGILVFLLRRKKETVRHSLLVAVILIVPVLPCISRMLTVAETGLPHKEIPVLPVYSVPQSYQFFAGNKAFPGLSENSEVSSEITTNTHVQTAEQISPVTLTDYPWFLALTAYCVGLMYFFMRLLSARIHIKQWITNGEAVIDERVIGIFESVRNMLGLHREILVVGSLNTSVPFTFRTVHPVVLLPEGFTGKLSDEELKAVAMHELSHVKRNDALTTTLVSLIQAVFFFHPLIWIAVRQISYLAEFTCDNAVLEMTGEPETYAGLISRIAEDLPHRLPAMCAVGIMYSKSVFYRRIKAILSGRRNRIRRLSKIGLAGTVLGLFLSIVIALAVPLGEIDRKTGGEEIQDEVVAAPKTENNRSDTTENISPNFAANESSDPQPQTKKRYTVTVADLKPVGISPDQSGKLSDSLKSSISHILKTIEYDNARCEYVSFEQPGTEPADFIVVGSAGQRGDMYSVTARVVHTKTGRIIGCTGRQHKGSFDEVINTVIPAISNDLFPKNGKELAFNGVEELQEGEHYTLAALDLEAKGVSTEEAVMLSDKMRTHIFQVLASENYRNLKNRDHYIMVERTQMGEILEHYKNSGAPDVEYGNMLQVDRILIGSIGITGVDIKLVDVESGMTVTTVYREHKGSVDEFVRKVIPKLVVELFPETGHSSSLQEREKNRISLESIQGEWLNKEYLEAMQATKSPCQAINAFDDYQRSQSSKKSDMIFCNGFIITPTDSSYYEWAQAYQFHEGLIPRITGLKPTTEPHTYSVVYHIHQTHGRTTKNDLFVIPDGKPVNEIEWIFTSVYSTTGKQQRYTFIRTAPTIDEYVNKLVIAGTYTDEKGRNFTFEESGYAVWPEKTFKYTVGLDCFWTQRKFDYFEVIGEKYENIYPMRYGFQWKDNRLLIYEIKKVNNDTTVERENEPLYTLTPQ